MAFRMARITCCPGARSAQEAISTQTISMISVLQAQELIDTHTEPLSAELLPLADIHGRVLREPVVASEDMPSFDRSAMDGYAVLENDRADEFEVVAEIRAGQA